MIHFKIDDDAVLERDILAVLAADFKNGVNGGIDDGGAGGLGGDFIYDEIGANEISGEISAGAGGGGAADLDEVADVVDHFEPFADGFEWSAGGHEVGFPQDAALFVHDDDVGADGADIDAEVGGYFFAAVACLGDKVVVDLTGGAGVGGLGQGFEPIAGDTFFGEVFV